MVIEAEHILHPSFSELNDKMSKGMYSEKVMEHFQNPKNMGEMEDPDAVGDAGNPVCGDQMRIYIKVKDNTITDISFKTFGCAAAIATSSMITEMAKGKKLEEAYGITRDDVADGLEGLPETKMHCSNLASDALKEAIKDYIDKNNNEIEINLEE